MPFLTLDKKKIHYQSFNDKAEDCIIALHAFGGDLSMYYFHYGPLWSSKYRVILYDFKSHGLSDYSLTGYSLEALADELALIQDHFSLSSTRLIGFSFGALVVLFFALRYPNRVKSMVLIEPPPSELMGDVVRFLLGFNRDAFEQEIKNIDCQIVTRLKLSQRSREKYFERHKFIFEKTSFIEELKTTKMITDESLNKCMHKTLLLYGSESEVLFVGERLGNEIKNSNLIIVDGRDHYNIIDQPNVISDYIADFWELVK